MINAVRLVYLVEWTLIALLLLLIVFQVAVPLLAGTPFFPILRKRTRDAANKVAEAVEEREIRNAENAASAMGGNATIQRKRKGA